MENKECRQCGRIVEFEEGKFCDSCISKSPGFPTGFREMWASMTRDEKEYFSHFYVIPKVALEFEMTIAIKL